MKLIEKVLPKKTSLGDMPKCVIAEILENEVRHLRISQREFEFCMQNLDEISV